MFYFFVDHLFSALYLCYLVLEVLVALEDRMCDSVLIAVERIAQASFRNSKDIQ